MGCNSTAQNLFFCQTLNYISISFLFLLISSSTHVRFKAEGRATPKSAELSASGTEKEEKMMMMRSQIGSRPPRCERRCSSCEHCEAIQVPTNPQTNHGNTRKNFSNNIAYARGDDASNYKPMSWKCKCGNLIFNP